MHSGNFRTKAFQLAWAQAQSDMTRKLYKFSGPNEYAIQNLENGVIYCQHYSAYNDPFEFWARIHDGLPDPNKEPDRFMAAKKAWGAQWMGDGDEYLTDYFASCIEDQPPFRSWINNTRIACFGTEPDDLLMWSHYGDGLRGFCIVFDESMLLKTEGNGFAVNVDYVKEPPKVDAFVWAIVDGLVEYNASELEEISGKHDGVSSEGLSESDIQAELKRSILIQQQMLRALFTTKPIEWEYEHERRLLVQAKTEDKVPVMDPYPENAIKEIILGELMPNEYRSRILNVLKLCYPDVPVKTARRSQERYSLVID